MVIFHPLRFTVMASSSSFSPLASHPLKYDVFLSFRGAETRRNFTSHLLDALCRKDILTFFDDDELKSGEEIAQSLLQAIQDSTVAVVVFSKDYASSSWCLDELAKIVECNQTHGQILVPVFYGIDPSHLRRQSHDVAAAFVKHEQNPKKAHKIQKWRDALTTAANLSGFHSKNFSNDPMLIDKIVEDILEKLNQSMICDDFGHLVGMDSRIKEIKKIFAIEPLKTRIIGIWGMGGLGKTTTAKIIYHMMSHQFQSCCFVHDVRQRAEASGIMKLQEKLISKALDGQDSLKYMFSAGPGPFLISRLHRKKMLIVLDDVDNQLQVEFLIGDPCWFGLESMILITSRDKEVFEKRVDFIYEVQPLNNAEALQLFSKSAFNRKNPENNYLSLSYSIVEYARGNPLVLKVLGSTLAGKNEKEWGGAIKQLSEVPNEDIQKMLEISYKKLNRVEKNVFLDMACFFKHVKRDILRQIYKTSRFDIDITLSVLVDKCLVTIFNGELKVHDLLKEMGKEIVRQEAKYPNQRSRLWDPEDIYEVFLNNKEAEAVESIILDVTKIKEINLDKKVFMKMPNLKFLYFYRNFEKKSNLHLSQGLDYLPNKLRYLYWNGCPLEFFPPIFHLKNLVVLKLPNSKIKHLGKETKEKHSVASLTNGFCNLFKIPSIYLGSSLHKLTSLILVWNESITHLPNGRSGLLEALEVLDLTYCSNLNTFPEISSNLKELHLNSTAIKQVPSSSVELLTKLKILAMRYCCELESLPSNFSKLTSLQKLHLSNCSRFKELPETIKSMHNLVYLDLDRTAVHKLPIVTPDHHELALSSNDMCSSRSLILSRCNLKELPEDLSFLSFVEELDLRENDFERIPESIKQLSHLRILHIQRCNRLQSLPEFPLTVSELYTEECILLQQISALKPPHLDSQAQWRTILLQDCLQLDEDECQAVAYSLLRNRLTAFARNQMQISVWSFEMMYPGSRIPEWVKYQSTSDSIQIHLPSHWFNHLFLGFSFYLCIDSCRFPSRCFRLNCSFGDSCHFFDAYFSPDPYYGGSSKEHVVVFVINKCECVYEHDKIEEEDVALFKFSSRDNGKASITKFGVIPLYAQEEGDEICETFDFPTLGLSKLKRSTSEESLHCVPKKRLKIEEIE